MENTLITGYHDIWSFSELVDFERESSYQFLMRAQQET